MIARLLDIAPARLARTRLIVVSLANTLAHWSSPRSLVVLFAGRKQRVALDDASLLRFVASASGLTSVDASCVSFNVNPPAPESTFTFDAWPQLLTMTSEPFTFSVAQRVRPTPVATPVPKGPFASIDWRDAQSIHDGMRAVYPGTYYGASRQPLVHAKQTGSSFAFAGLKQLGRVLLSSVSKRARELATGACSFTKDMFTVPVAAGAPGVGKSRILDCALDALCRSCCGTCGVLAPFLEHVADVRVTHTSGFSLDVELEARLGGVVAGLCARILYAVFVPPPSSPQGSTWADFVTALLACGAAFSSITLPRIVDVVWIALGRPKRWLLYLAIDEAALLSKWSGRGMSPEHTTAGGATTENALHKVLQTLGETICQPSRGELLVPLLAGAEPATFTSAFHRSSYKSAPVPCGLLAYEDVVAAVSPVLDARVPTWRTCAKIVDGLVYMGGHMRSVEHFVDGVVKHSGGLRDVNELPIESVLDEVRAMLRGYKLPSAEVCDKLVRAALLHTVHDDDTPLVPGGPTLESLVPSGLFEIDAMGHVRLPHIQCVRMLEKMNKTHVRSIVACRALELLQMRVLKDAWQDWERFNAAYHALRLTLLACDADAVTGAELFDGALLGPDVGKTPFHLARGRVYEWAESKDQFVGDVQPAGGSSTSQSIGSASGVKTLVRELAGTGTYGNIRFRDRRVVVRNGASAPWADWFVWLPRLEGMDVEHGEVFEGFIAGQCKHGTPASVSATTFAQEARKVQERAPTSLFGLYTNWKVDTDVTPGARQVLVGAAQFDKYYGWVLADRARRMLGTLRCVERMRLCSLRRDVCASSAATNQVCVNTAAQ